jgi:Protein of unknown function (DUF1329)
MMINFKKQALLIALSLCGAQAIAAVSDDQAKKLNGELTPFGAERAGNKDNSIPAWQADTLPVSSREDSGRRGDPFKNETKLFSITVNDIDKYADKLTDGTKAMLKKYPDSFRVDVYKTHRTASAPQWVYDNTLKNATRAKMDGDIVEGAYGGIPFPIPSSGKEVMWNHLLRWRGTSVEMLSTQYQLLTNGKPVLATDIKSDMQMPYYFKDSNLEAFSKDPVYWTIKVLTSAPAIRAGEGVVGRQQLDPDKTQSWVYLTGQRRVRKIPNACCDTPSPPMAGVMSYDEIETFAGRLDRFDWTIAGKKEMYIPYNGNRILQPHSDTDVMDAHHLKPEFVRWELHRVWVIDAVVRSGQRHQAPKSRYYCDEDSWVCVLGDRWDAQGQLWKTTWSIASYMPDIPAVAITNYGFNDLLSGKAFIGGLYNSKNTQYSVMPRYPDRVFTPDALAGESLR